MHLLKLKERILNCLSCLIVVFIKTCCFLFVRYLPYMSDNYIYKFVCQYWQWPILIKCVKCYYLCVLRWLMRPILALYCLLQIAQERSEEESSLGDALTLSFRCTRFCSASLILFASYSPAPPSYEASSLCSILCNLFLRLCWYVEVFQGGFEGVLVSLLLTTMGAFSYL